MTDSQLLCVLINLCAVRRTSISESIDLDAPSLERLAVLATRHGVATWLLHRLRTDYRQAPWFTTAEGILRKHALSELVSARRKCATFIQIADTLAQHGIKAIALKGVAMMLGYYPEMSMRTVGDIDLMVDYADVFRAFDILVARGARSAGTMRTMVINDAIRTHLPPLSIDGVEVELHARLYSRDSCYNLPEELLKRTHSVESEGNKVHVLDAEVMLYHLLTHLAKNKFSEGLRANWLVDIVVLFQQCPDVEAVCAKVLSFNPKARMPIMSALGLVANMLPEHMGNQLVRLSAEPQPLNESLLEGKGNPKVFGRGSRMRTAYLLCAAAVRFVRNAKGFKSKCQMIADIWRDLMNLLIRNKKI